MSSALAYPLRLPGWKLAVHLGLSIKTEVLVAVSYTHLRAHET